MGVVDAADETHAGVGLFVHERSSLCRLNYEIGIGFGQTSLIPKSGNSLPLECSIEHP